MVLVYHGSKDGLMAKDKELNAKQKLFCKEYIIDFNATKAAERSGYSSKTAKSQGSRLLTHVNISVFIESLIEEKLKLEKGELRYKVLKGVSEIAFDDISIDIATDRDGNPISLRLNDRLKALEMLGKYGSLWNDKLELSGKLETENTNLNINVPDMTPEEAKTAFFDKINDSKK